MEKKPKGKAREYAESLLIALVIAFFIRSFVLEAFKIPSGSMIPTLMIGDHIFVNKFIYGLRIPFTKKKVVHFRDPARGEAIVFMYPVDTHKDFIKRVIGLPGDRLRLDGDTIFVNDRKTEKIAVRLEPAQNPRAPRLQVARDANAADIGAIPSFEGWGDYSYFVEVTDGIRHLVQYDSNPSWADSEVVVPPGHLFVMGDNRDNSSDSREWGFVPLENVKGKAMFVWLSIDFERKTLRWDRFGKWIK